MMYDVFISYRRIGKPEQAKILYKYLRQRGFKVYFDLDEKYAGDFKKNIKEAIQNSHLLVLFVTEGSFERMENSEDISRLEIETAIESGIEILPISYIESNNVFEILQSVIAEFPALLELKDINWRFVNDFNAEMEFIHRVSTDIRYKKLSEIIETNHIQVDTLSKELYKDFTEQVDNLKFTIGSTIYTYKGILLFGRFHGNSSIYDPLEDKLYEVEWHFTDENYCFGRVIEKGITTYRGNFYNLEFHGEGILYNGFGNSMKGIFKFGRLIEKLSEASCTKETTCNNELKNPVKYLTSNTFNYYGEINEARPSGYGIKTFTNGQKESGIFKDGQIWKGIIEKKISLNINGDFEEKKCIFKTSKSDTINSYFSESKLIGYGYIFNEDETKIYEGYFKDGEPYLHGTFYMNGKHLEKLPLRDEMIEKLLEYHPNIKSFQLEIKSQFNNYNFFNISKEIIIKKQNSLIPIFRGLIDKLDECPPYVIYDEKGKSVFNSVKKQIEKYKKMNILISPNIYIDDRYLNDRYLDDLKNDFETRVHWYIK